MKKLAEVYQKGSYHSLVEWDGTQLLVYDSIWLLIDKPGQKGFSFLGKSFTDFTKIRSYFSGASKVTLIGGGSLNDATADRRQFLVEIKMLILEQEIEVDHSHFMRGDVYRIKLGESVKLDVVKGVESEFVTLVDDSRTFLKVFETQLKAMNSQHNLVSSVSPFDAIELSTHPKNSLLITDINMPEISGLKLTKILNQRLPILMMSGEITSDSPDVVSAMECGRVDFVIKSDVKNSSILDKIEALKGSKSLRAVEQGNSGISGKKNLKPVKNLEAMFIGTSTGGVQTLEAILRELGPLPFPVFVMIHMPGQFTREFAKRLNSTYSAFEVIHVERDTQMEKKAVYLGCGDNHFMIFEGEGGFKIKVVHGEKVKGFCPNIDFAFKSLAKNKCRRVGAGILTGMGRDGAQGLLEIKDAGGFTYCQDEDTSVVYGMPKAAKEIGAQQAILNPKQIARWFNDRS